MRLEKERRFEGFSSEISHFGMDLGSIRGEMAQNGRKIAEMSQKLEILGRTLETSQQRYENEKYQFKIQNEGAIKAILASPVFQTLQKKVAHMEGGIPKALDRCRGEIRRLQALISPLLHLWPPNLKFLKSQIKPGVANSDINRPIAPDASNALTSHPPTHRLGISDRRHYWI